MVLGKLRASIRLRSERIKRQAAPLSFASRPNARVMVANLEQTFSRLGTFDPDAVNSVPLRAAKPWLDNPFSDNEISAAVRKLANG